jgi:hypothetical protein
MMQEFIIASGISVVLIAVSILVFYEVLRVAWRRKERYHEKPRSMIYHLVLAIFLAHTLCVWAYGLGYWLMIDVLHVGDLVPTNGLHTLDGAPGSFARLLTYVYFSVTCYSSLGFGDFAPGGVIRMIAGIEALNGLLLIGWSVTYTYFATDRFLAHEQKK